MGVEEVYSRKVAMEDRDVTYEVSTLSVFPVVGPCHEYCFLLICYAMNILASSYRYLIGVKYR